ncbi:MAG: CAP domain-containing protein [Candidatus Dormibacterales bacterium]
MRNIRWLGGIATVLAVIGAATVLQSFSASGAAAQAANRPALAANRAGAPVDYSASVPSYTNRLLLHRDSLQPNPAPVAPAPPQVPATHSQLVAPAPAPRSLAIGSNQQVLINQDRAAAGLGPLSWSSCLARVAVSNAQRMVAQGFISHTNGPNVDLACGLGYYAGENVGYWGGGVDDAQLNTLFMNSADHRANIMGPYHYVATAWLTAPNGTGYIAVEFS